MNDEEQQEDKKPKSHELQNFINHLKKDKSALKLIIYLIINLGFTFVEFIYGYWSNSLGLISDSFHMLFDSSAIAIGLYASYMATKKPNDKYPFG